jgi:hypothetical protein
MSDINIRIGGDNSDFKRALADSERASRSFNQRVSQDAEEGARRTGLAILKRLDIRMGITAIAAAVGFSFQNIADGIARMFIGFSKAQEEALNTAVEATAKAAAAQEAALDRLRGKKAKEAAEKKEAISDEEKMWLDFYKKEEDRRRKLLENEKERTDKRRKEMAQQQVEDTITYKRQEDERRKEKLEGIAAVKAAELAASEEVSRLEKARIDEKFKSLIDQWTQAQVQA